MKTTAEMIEVMQAAERGEVIEMRSYNAEGGWANEWQPVCWTGLLFNWGYADYRIHSSEHEDVEDDNYLEAT